MIRGGVAACCIGWSPIWLSPNELSSPKGVYHQCLENGVFYPDQAMVLSTLPGATDDASSQTSARSLSEEQLRLLGDMSI